MNTPIYVIDGARTPFLKSRNRPGPFAASDLATAAGRSLLMRQPFSPTELDEVILGCAAPSVDEVNIGRVAAQPRITSSSSVGENGWRMSSERPAAVARSLAANGPGRLRDFRNGVRAPSTI